MEGDDVELTATNRRKSDHVAVVGKVQCRQVEGEVVVWSAVRSIE